MHHDDNDNDDARYEHPEDRGAVIITIGIALLLGMLMGIVIMLGIDHLGGACGG